MNESRRSGVLWASPCRATWPLCNKSFEKSRSSFPNGACLHFSHVRLGKWDILELTGTSLLLGCELTTVLYSCQPETFTGARRGSEHLNHIQKKRVHHPSALHPLIPSQQQHFAAASSPAPATRHRTREQGKTGCQREAGLGRPSLRSSQEEKSLAIYFFK